MIIGNLPFIMVAVFIAIGLYAVMFKHNLIKIVIGVSIIESAVNLFLIAAGYVKGGIAPIYTSAPQGREMVMPTPQALTLTSIVIGLATTALMLSFAMLIYKHYKTLDARKIRGLRE